MTVEIREKNLTPQLSMQEVEAKKIKELRSQISMLKKQAQMMEREIDATEKKLDALINDAEEFTSEKIDKFIQEEINPHVRILFLFEKEFLSPLFRYKGNIPDRNNFSIALKACIKVSESLICFYDKLNDSLVEFKRNSQISGIISVADLKKITNLAINVAKQIPSLLNVIRSRELNNNDVNELERTFGTTFVNLVKKIPDLEDERNEWRQEPAKKEQETQNFVELNSLADAGKNPFVNENFAKCTPNQQALIQKTVFEDMLAKIAKEFAYNPTDKAAEPRFQHLTEMQQAMIKDYYETHALVRTTSTQSWEKEGNLDFNPFEKDTYALCSQEQKQYIARGVVNLMKKKIDNDENYKPQNDARFSTLPNEERKSVQDYQTSKKRATKSRIAYGVAVMTEEAQQSTPPQVTTPPASTPLIQIPIVPLKQLKKEIEEGTVSFLFLDSNNYKKLGSSDEQKEAELYFCEKIKKHIDFYLAYDLKSNPNYDKLSEKNRYDLQSYQQEKQKEKQAIPSDISSDKSSQRSQNSQRDSKITSVESSDGLKRASPLSGSSSSTTTTTTTTTTTSELEEKKPEIKKGESGVFSFLFGGGNKNDNQEKQSTTTATPAVQQSTDLINSGMLSNSTVPQPAPSNMPAKPLNIMLASKEEIERKKKEREEQQKKQQTTTPSTTATNTAATTTTTSSNPPAPVARDLPNASLSQTSNPVPPIAQTKPSSSRASISGRQQNVTLDDSSELQKKLQRMKEKSGEPTTVESQPSNSSGVLQTQQLGQKQRSATALGPQSGMFFAQPKSQPKSEPKAGAKQQPSERGLPTPTPKPK